MDKYSYDIFISYRRIPKDSLWVHKSLIPALESKGLSVCVDETCFGLGALILTEMQRAIKESRYTIGIFTPEYLKSGFTQLENIMSNHLALEESKTRFIGIVYNECDPPLLNRSALMVNMTDDTKFDENIDRIVNFLSEVE